MELPPATKYIKRRGKDFAYQAFGHGPRSLVVFLDITGHPDLMWTDPFWTDNSARLAGMCRVVFFQQAGLGLSQEIDRVPTLEQQASDILAVMDAENMPRAMMLAASSTAMPVMLLAAQSPERVDGLVLDVPFAKGWRSGDIDDNSGVTPEEAVRLSTAYDDVFAHWGEGLTVDLWDPVIAPRNRRVVGMLERSAASPAAAAAVYEAAMTADVREVLPLISAPTHVLRHATCGVPEGVARLVAELIPGAVYKELPASRPQMSFGESFSPVVDYVIDVMAGRPSGVSDGRQLATILFTDVVSSTELIVKHGDSRWRELLERHEGQIRERVEENDGRLVKMFGDGSMSIFPGPAAAIRAAKSLSDDAHALEIGVRAGVHTGECDRRPGGDISGLAVHIAARVGASAGAGEVWVSRTVRDLVGGSGLQMSSRGTHELKGVNEPWELFAVGAEDHVAASIEQQPSPMRASDRFVVATARHAPGLLRGLNRIDHARRRSLSRAA